MRTAVMSTRDVLARRLSAARARTDELFDLIRPEALYHRPIPERHRLIFYLGHVEAFDWNLLCRFTLDWPSFHPTFDRLFAFGIDPEPGKAPSDTPSDWPREGEVRAYGHRIRAAVEEAQHLVDEEIMHVALEHRLMHAETLAYLLHELPVDDKLPGPIAHATEQPVGRYRMLEIPTGTATLGKQSTEGFGWDNEFPEVVREVPAFRVGKRKVTNADYFEFVSAGARAPHFWMKIDRKWHYRGMFGSVPLPLDAPVYVTHAEAAAYAQWRGKRLPSEAEWHRAAYGSPCGERFYPWGCTPPTPLHGNFDFQYWDPIPVEDSPAGDSAYGAAQMVGNGWEWTSSLFEPFPGFAPRPSYPGYSADFFDGAHYVMKGGSPRTAACMLRRSFRNWFRPDYPYVYATFRLAENL